jgi:hypothetical protein
VLHHLQHDLQHRPGISGVSVNQDAGSLTVHYDAQRYPDSSLLDIRKDLDIILGAVLDVPHLAAVDSAPSQAAKTFINALEDLDHRISALTGRTLNLRVLVPLGLVGVGVWQLFKNGLMLDSIPGWLLVWFAFDAFVELYPQRVSPAAAAANAQASEY